MPVDSTDIAVHLTPRSGENRIDGWRDGVLHVWVTAPPSDGRANEALIRVVARAIHVAPTTIAIVSGRASRRKRLRISGLPGPELAARLDKALT